MKFLFDLFPIILFFVAYKFAGIFAATAVAIAATVGQIGYHGCTGCERGSAGVTRRA